ncbi:MAG TPA: peptidyl-alpha-hydroxyglycine alpha-amidating lyase family protein [Candidatus Acidoferrum sp.]|jgi:sugar lactone lactonase YvrE|nr:peptidyl-alpha-hydroxyglycine alpha-amidating lyase family protein [Candidatus Acidoferrum sp.]
MTTCQSICLALAAWTCATPVFAQSSPDGLTPAQLAARAKARDVPEIPFESAPDVLKLPPNIYLGEGIGVATNSKGHIFVYTRAQATRLFEFDAKGVYLREIGEGLYGLVFAHMVRVDPQDNIWVVDEGSNMVIKFNPQGRVMMVLGRRPEPFDGPPPLTPPTAEPYEFGRPTDVAWDPAGNIFISDGYGNSRVVKYDKNGRFVKAVGSRGSEPGQMNLPHTIAADAKGNIYVGDRSNSRIQVFDSDLNLKTIYDKVGAPWAVCITPGPHQYLYSSNSYPDNNNSQLAAVTGEIYKMELDGTIVGKFGHAGKKLGEFSTVHEIDCRNENELLISEITAWRVQKLTLHPRRPQ